MAWQTEGRLNFSSRSASVPLASALEQSMKCTAYVAGGLEQAAGLSSESVERVLRNWGMVLEFPKVNA